MQNSNSNDGTEVPISTTADYTTSSQTIAKPNVSRSYFRNCYRVIEDEFNGYEAQVKFWWFPYSWVQMWKGFSPINTWASLKEAQDFINNPKSKRKNKRKIYWVSENCG